eukprot:scaffold358_cov343-Pavlova_lutheri.AAC.2
MSRTVEGYVPGEDLGRHPAGWEPSCSGSSRCVGVAADARTSRPQGRSGVASIGRCACTGFDLGGCVYCERSEEESGRNTCVFATRHGTGGTGGRRHGGAHSRPTRSRGGAGGTFGAMVGLRSAASWLAERRGTGPGHAGLVGRPVWEVEHAKRDGPRSRRGSCFEGSDASTFGSRDRRFERLISRPTLPAPRFVASSPGPCSPDGPCQLAATSCALGTDPSFCRHLRGFHLWLSLPFDLQIRPSAVHLSPASRLVRRLFLHLGFAAHHRVDLRPREGRPLPSSSTQPAPLPARTPVPLAQNRRPFRHPQRTGGFPLLPQPLPSPSRTVGLVGC